MAIGSIGILLEPESKEEVRYERVKPHSIDHLLECHTKDIGWVKTDSQGRVSKVALNGLRGRVIYEVEY